MEAKDWPDWVLTFHGGFFPIDPVRQALLQMEFRKWQQDRAIWFEAQGVTFSPRECRAEVRRRATAWQLLHPEDRRPSTTQQKLIERKANEST